MKTRKRPSPSPSHWPADDVVQAAAPARLILGSIPTEALVAHLLVSKYAYHLLLYRKAQIYSRQGVELERSTLDDWVGRAAFELRLIRDTMMADLKRSTKLFMDETRAPVSIPGRARPRPDTSGRSPAMTVSGASSLWFRLVAV